VYQTDSDSSGDSSRLDTVIITDGDRAQNGLIQQVLPATYLGAIIVCEGGDRAEVRLAIAEAVSHFTGLGMDRISVLKMK
jgi:stage III sporulation protein AG